MSTPETTRPLAIWVTGEPVPRARQRRGSFANMIQEAVGSAWEGPWVEVACEREDTPLSVPSEVAGVIITGSSARVADQVPWMQRVQQQLCVLVERRVPTFGICFGHQLLGMALGGRSGPNPRGREIGTAVFALEKPDSLLGESRAFPVSMTHLDSVLELPPGAVCLGSTALERHAAVRFAEQAWGVQFHPEIDRAVMGDYVESRRGLLSSEGLDPDGLLGAAVDTPEAAGLLSRFARYVRNRER